MSLGFLLLSLCCYLSELQSWQDFLRNRIQLYWIELFLVPLFERELQGVALV